MISSKLKVFKGFKGSPRGPVFVQTYRNMGLNESIHANLKLQTAIININFLTSSMWGGKITNSVNVPYLA